jgi:hypothetical protein
MTQGYLSLDVPEGEGNTAAPAGLPGQAIAHLVLVRASYVTVAIASILHVPYRVLFNLLALKG